MNPDNTVRFVGVDTTNLDSVGIKLYLKGSPSQGSFYSQNSDPTFQDSIKECVNNKIIINRLYNKPATFQGAIDERKESPQWPDIKLPRCITTPDNGKLKTNYINIFTLPEGTRLDRKCFKEEKLTKHNSCLPYLRLISSGLLHALKAMNMGNSYYRHGNIFPHNIFLLLRNDTERVFLDNMLYESNKYDDISQKPFKRDFNMMGDALIQMLTGTRKKIVKGPIKSTFELYHTIRKYFYDNTFEVSLKSAAINSALNIKEGNGKCITKTEFDFKLQKSLFNFIYRLKCTGVTPFNQFMDIDQALNHSFLTSGLQTGPKAPGEQWDSLPADY